MRFPESGPRDVDGQLRTWRTDDPPALPAPRAAATEFLLLSSRSSVGAGVQQRPLPHLVPCVPERNGCRARTAIRGAIRRRGKRRSGHANSYREAARDGGFRARRLRGRWAIVRRQDFKARPYSTTSSTGHDRAAPCVLRLQPMDEPA